MKEIIIKYSSQLDIDYLNELCFRTFKDFDPVSGNVKGSISIQVWDLCLSQKMSFVNSLRSKNIEYTTR